MNIVKINWSTAGQISQGKTNSRLLNTCPQQYSKFLRQEILFIRQT